MPFRALATKPLAASVAWKALESRSYPGVEGTFVHPFDDHNFIGRVVDYVVEVVVDQPVPGGLRVSGECAGHARGDRSVAGQLGGAC